MFPFPDTGIRLIHNEKVHDAMERARIDVELTRGSRRTIQMSLLRNVLIRIRLFGRIEHLHRRPRAIANQDTCDSR
jgi:hypothetical protein